MHDSGVCFTSSAMPIYICHVNDDDDIILYVRTIVLIPLTMYVCVLYCVLITSPYLEVPVCCWVMIIQCS